MVAGWSPAVSTTRWRGTDTSNCASVFHMACWPRPIHMVVSEFQQGEGMGLSVEAFFKPLFHMWLMPH